MSEENTATDILSMSDEAIENMAFPPGEEPTEEISEEQPSTPAESEASAPEVLEEESTDEQYLSEDDSDFENEEEPQADPFAEGDPQGEPEAEGQQEENIEEEEIISSELQELYKPFRANGKEMQVSSVEDARTLMQMGANYNKKMAALKPNLKMLKMLENNDLLSEDKINYLIDLEKKNPNAISKLVKESGLDPLDIDDEQSDEYTPNSYNVSDEQFAFDTTIDDLKQSPVFEKTVNIVDTKWDDASKQVLLKDPQSLGIINDHVERGIYDQVMDIVEEQQTLGKLNNMSTIEAYKYVGSLLESNGAFNNQLDTSTGSKPPVSKSNVQSQAVRQAEQQRTSKKKAASSPTSKVSSNNKIPDNFNPLSLSDEEFEKFDHKLFG